MTMKMYGFNKHSSFHSAVSHWGNKVSIGTVFNEKQIRMDVTLNSHGLFKGTLPTFIKGLRKTMTSSGMLVSHVRWKLGTFWIQIRNNMLGVPTKHTWNLFWEIMFKHSGKVKSTRCYEQHVRSTAFSETSNTYLTVARIFPQIKKVS